MPNNRPIPLEQDDQIKVISWADKVATFRWPEYTLDYGDKRGKIFPIFHVPNGQLRNRYVGRVLKRAGARSGILDLWLMIPSGDYHGLVIEMKRVKGGRLEDAQIMWIEFFERMGFIVAVCEGAESAISTITEYMETING